MLYIIILLMIIDCIAFDWIGLNLNVFTSVLVLNRTISELHCKMESGKCAINCNVLYIIYYYYYYYEYYIIETQNVYNVMRIVLYCVCWVCCELCVSVGFVSLEYCGSYTHCDDYTIQYNSILILIYWMWLCVTPNVDKMSNWPNHTLNVTITATRQRIELSWVRIR